MIKLIIASLIIFSMILFRRRLPYIIIICLFLFSTINSQLWTFLGIPPSICLETLKFLRWVSYVGFIILGIIYNQKGNIRKFIHPDIFLAFFMILLPLSIMISIRPEATFQRGISIILMYLAFFFGVYSYVDDTHKIYKICSAMLIFLIIYNIMSCIPGIGLRLVKGRLAGLSGYPTGSGAINAFIFPIALMTYTIKRTKINLLLIFFSLTITYLTFTRTSLIVIILSTIFFYSQYFRRRRIIFVFIALLMIVTVFFSFFIFGVWLPERLVRLENLPVLGGRLEAWNAAKDIIATRPLYGFGFGTEELLLQKFSIQLKKHSGDYFHNSFLGLAAQIGIPFAIIFFTAIGVFTISTINFVSKITDRHFYLIGITLNTILFVGFIYCFTESWIYSAGNILTFIYFTVVVLVVCLKKLLKEKI